MLTAITMSALLGALSPAVFRRLDIDPALASGPFVTMCNDILGIVLYMAVAVIFLNVLA
jgi:magnesium transporter